MSATQTVYFELDDLDIFATVTADMVKEDYGVPRSPVWYAATNLDVETVTVGEDEHTPETLEKALGTELADKILAAVVEKAEAGEWGDPDDWHDGPDRYDED